MQPRQTISIGSDVAEGGTQSRALLLGWGLGLGGAGLLSLAAITIYEFAHAVVGSGPIIFWDTGGWIALPIALALLALALALFVGRHHGHDVDGPRSDAIKRLLALAAYLLPFVIVLPFSAHWLAAWHLEAQGYTACGNRFWIAADRMPDAKAALARCDVLWQD